MRIRTTLLVVAAVASLSGVPPTTPRNAALLAQDAAASSTTTIALEIVTVTGERATVMAKDGGRATITLDRTGAVALTPILHGEDLEVRFTDLSAAGVPIDLPSVTLARGVPLTLAGVPAISQLTWVSVTVSRVATEPAVQCHVGTQAPLVDAVTGPPQTDSPCSVCCVSCGGATVCGCGVSSGCGFCCCPGCGC